MATFSKISCYEDLNDRTEVFTDEGLTATTGLWCAYADRFALCNDLVMSRRVYPYSNLRNCICKSAEPTLQGGHPSRSDQGFELQDTDFVKVIATFEMDSSEREEDEEQEQPEDERPYSSVVEDLDVGAQFLPMDHKNFRWVTASENAITWGSPLKAEEAPSKLQPTMKLIRTLKKVKQVPQQILSLAGHVNKSAYTSKYNGINYAPETLLFLGARLANTYTELGSNGFDMQLNFGIHAVSWNKFYDKESDGWREIAVDNGMLSSPNIYKPYPPANFGWLLSITGSFE